MREYGIEGARSGTCTVEICLNLHQWRACIVVLGCTTWMCTANHVRRVQRMAMKEATLSSSINTERELSLVCLPPLSHFFPFFLSLASLSSLSPLSSIS